MAEVEKTPIPARREAIVAAATDAFLAHGYSGTSMSQLAAATGVTKATLYHHFPGKEALFSACVAHGYDHALDALGRLAARSDLSPEERMRDALHQIYDCVVHSPVGRLSPLIAEVSRSVPSVARAFHDDFVLRQEALLDAILDDGIAAGIFADVDREVFHHLVAGPVVTLSLSREMFACFDDLDARFPTERLRDGHVAALMAWLRASA